jgi:iron complex outermembrane receptor protein
VIAFETGYRAQLSKKISTSISAYYNLYDNIRSADFSPPPAPAGLPILFENNLKGQTYGAELTADYQILDWWRLHGGYDLLKEHIYVKSGRTDLNNAHNEIGDPQQQVFLRSSMDLPWKLTLDAGARWIDTLTLNNGPTLATVPSYFEMDARLAWQATKHIEVSIVGQNLLHDRHQEYGYPGNPATEEIVRSVYGEVTCRF